MIDTALGFRNKIKSIDYLLVLAAVALSVMGLLCIYEVGGFGEIRMQIIAILLGLCGMSVTALFNYEYFTGKIMSFLLFALSVGILVLTLKIGTGEGNQSWIAIGSVTVQPSEFVKILFIITFATHLNAVKENINGIFSVLGLCLHGGVIIGLVGMQGDLGSALVYAFIFVTMLFSAGLSLWYLLGGLLLIVAASPFLWPHLNEYQQQRILVGFNPELDPLGKGYQPILSKNAISAGGLSGVGMGNTEIAPTIPKSHNDMIFGVMGELFGFAGLILFFLLMSVLVLRLLRLSKNARKDTGSYICAGIAAILIAQTLENVGMCLGLLPVIGTTPPFVSSGGSSVQSLYLAIGLALSVGAHNKKYYFERERS